MSLQRTLPILLAITMIAYSISATAELIVIYDNGNTRPISDFLGPASQPAQVLRQSPVDPPALADIREQLPIESPGLEPGEIESREIDLPFAAAFFVIGSDVNSLQWLAEHRDRLLNQGASGLLVQADRLEDLEAVAAIAGDLPIAPVSGTEIAQLLGIRYYPFAVTEGQLWQ